MAHINLLPWREELRKERNRDFTTHCFIVAILMALVIGGVHYAFLQQIRLQKQRNDLIQDQITALDKKIKDIKDLDGERARLVARMDIIQQLQSSRPEIVHLFDELVKTLPEGIYYKRITQKGRLLTLQGVAQSNARVSSLMRKLEASPWLENPSLLEIKRAPQKKGTNELLRLSDFKMTVAQTRQKKPGEEEDKQ